MLAEEETHFFTSERLFPFGHANRNALTYQPPSSLNLEAKSCQELLDSLGSPEKVPGDILSPATSESLEKHGFKKGEVLEYLRPMTRSLEMCTVEDVSKNGKFFTVRLSCSGETLCCHKNSDNIFEAGWAERAGIKIEGKAAQHAKKAGHRKFPSRSG